MNRPGATRRTVWLLAFLLPLSAQTSPNDQAFWKGTSPSYAIEWSRSSLRATRLNTKQTVFDARADAQAAWAGIVQRSKGAPVKAEFNYRLLSVAGPYLSIEEEEYCDCGGAHPTAVKKFRAIQLDHSKVDSPQPAALNDLFTPEAISKALGADALVKKTLGSEAAPESLNSLIDHLADQSVKVGECEYAIPPNLMNSFALYAVKADSVQVRLGLPSAIESCRGRLTQIGLTLPSSTATQTLFSAKENQGILLMEQAARLQGSGATSFEFSQPGNR
jgi:hypothetical protein